MSAGLEVADVFRRHGEAYRRAHDGHLSRVERQPDNPGIAARSKDLREQVLLKGKPSAWRFATDQEMPFPTPRQQLRLVIWLSLVRRHNLRV